MLDDRRGQSLVDLAKVGGAAGIEIFTAGDVGDRLERYRPAAGGGHRQVLECREVAAAVRRQAHADRHLATGDGDPRGCLREALAEQFAGREPQTRFDGVAYRFGPSGSPILAGTLAYVDCTLGEELTAGTHTIFLGNVIEAGDRDGAPLGYYDRNYRDFGVR